MSTWASRGLLLLLRLLLRLPLVVVLVLASIITSTLRDIKTSVLQKGARWASRLVGGR